MDDYYDLQGNSIFTIFAIGEFGNSGRNQQRQNAEADAATMRQSLESLGMTECRYDMGHKRRITKEDAVSCISELTNGQELQRFNN